MNILLGLQLAADNCLPVLRPSAFFDAIFSPSGFISWLEGQYGLSHPSGDIDFLRSEQYRQHCAAYLAAHPEVFFAASFQADQRATATELLSRRDELISGGLPLAQLSGELPRRLFVLAHLERRLQQAEAQAALLPGFADRLDALCAVLQQGRLPDFTLYLHEAAAFLPPGLHRILQILQAAGIKVAAYEAAKITKTETDLDRWRYRLQSGGQQKLTAAADGSLLLLRAKRETPIAAYLARVLRMHPSWKPAVLLPSRDQTLNNALVLEGLPDLGVTVNSLGRPGLQVLKLVTVFLWEPVDLRKIMEFLNLSVKPLDAHLANYLAKHLADTPGLYGERWSAAVYRYFEEELPKRLAFDKQLKAERIQAQFDSWFRRKRYPKDGKVPKAEVRSLFRFLLTWAREQADPKKTASLPALQQLATQAERMLDLLDVLPEEQLSFLETDRLVRSIYAATPTCFQEKEVGSLPICYEAAAVYEPVDHLIWWDFIEKDPNYFFSRWTVEELAFLTQQGIQLLSPQQQNNRLVWQWQRPVLHTQSQLILCIPQRSNGEEVLPHPLLGTLEATFGEAGLAAMTLNIDDDAGNTSFCWPGMRLPKMEEEPLQLLAAPSAFIQLQQRANLVARAVETPTSLEKLLFYPYQWVLEHAAKLRSTAILDIAADNRLRGNLAHRLIERLLKARNNETWDKNTTYQWVNTHFEQLLRQEGAIFLEYGREPERVQLINRLRYAAWALVDALQQNNWLVAGTEVKMEGRLAGLELQGRADLELSRGMRETTIVDLKWQGKTNYRSLLKNREDIQLGLYASFVDAIGRTVHTAYFVIYDALFIARNKEAFQEAEAVSPEADHLLIHREMMDRVAATYEWRSEQLARGLLEIRCAATATALEESYQDVAHEALLEMKNQDAQYDKYQTLIGLVR